MFNAVAYVALISVVIWAIVSLIKHFVPDYYSRSEDRFSNALHKRLDAIEEHLGIKVETKTSVVAKDDQPQS